MSSPNDKKTKSFGRVGIFVMGDIGRSPRMMNHAIEFAQHPETIVEIIGHQETELPLFLAEEDIYVRTISSNYLKKIKSLPSLVYLIVRMIIETFILIYHFFYQIKPRYDCLVVQNPPGIPVLMVLFLYQLMFKVQIWVDVHNFGFTLYQTKVKYLLWFLKFIEMLFIRLTANRVFCVSKLMQEYLANEWKIKNSTVLYDKPNFRYFKKLNLRQKHNFLLGFKEFSKSSTETVISGTTANNQIYEKKDRPLLFVVSSSWSHDDYFELLLQAVIKYSANSKNKSELILIMTGSGPMKQYYSQVFLNLDFPQIKFVILWFKMSDYPKLIGCVDYGISLHNSTSGFDLPIKALDYMACEVPCLAYNYGKTITELVLNRKNGILFSDADDLAKIFEELSQNKSTIKWEFTDCDWTQEWKSKVYLST